MWSDLLYRIRALFRRDLVEKELDAELRFHLERQTEKYLRAGLPPDAAARRARLDLGNADQVKEECRDARATRLLEDLWQDVRYSLRTLRQKPAFAAVTLSTLALGIGATTIMFTVIHSVLLKPLPFTDPEHLLTLQEQTERATQYGNRWAFAYPNFLDAQRSVRKLSLAAIRYRGGTVRGSGDGDYANGREISAELFSVLGLSPHQGRAFLPDEDRPGASPVAIIGYGLWQRLFAGDPSIIGRQIHFAGSPYTVVGIAPPNFRWQGEVDLFLPIGQNTGPFMKNRSAHPGISVVARLQPGQTLQEARTELALIGRRLAEQYPDSNEGRTFIADPLRANVGNARSTLWLLLGAVSVVLLIACVNVASLLLARAVSRERELAMRTALGASRGRLIRQCLADSAMLGLSGGVLGVGLAMLGLRPFVAFWPGNLPRAEEVQFDWLPLLFALAVSLACALLFGLAPAMRVPSRDLERTLHAGGRTSTGNSRRLHGVFVAAEVGLAVVLLVSAGILGRTLLSLSSADTGLNVENVLVTRMALSPGTLEDPVRIRAAWDAVLDGARRLPGVEAIAAVDTVPMRAGNNQLAFWPSPSLPPRDQLPLALATSVTPDYLKVMGIPLLRGRFFEERDRLGAEPVAVIDEILAKQAFNGADAVGRQIWVPDSGISPLRVVGVVRHVRHWGLAGDDDASVRAQLYYPLAQLPNEFMRRWSELMSIAVRTTGEPMDMIATLRRELRGDSGDQVLYEVRTLDELATDSLAQQRFLLLLFGVFSGWALLLACIGIYGVMTYITNQRVPEIGVRMALGATRGAILRMILGQSSRLILAGVLLGTAASLAAGRALMRLVPGVRHMDPSTVAAMIAILAAAAMLASFLPARQASRADPLKALRKE
jgi:predicted permease